MFKCCDCKEDLPAEAFGSDRSKKDGRNRRCRACVRARGRKAWSGRTEERRQYQREWYARNTGAILKRKATYRDANRDRLREAERAAMAARPEKRRLDAHSRRARLRGALVDRSVTLSALRERDGDFCCYCGSPLQFGGDPYAPRSATVEHITPISRGGTHTFSNTAIACRACNVSKHSKELLTEWTMRAA